MNVKDPAFDGLQKWPDALVRRYLHEGLWGTSNFARWINTLLSERSDNIVLSGPGFPKSHWQDLSGHELANLVKRLAKGLSDLGLVSGDRVVMQMNNGNAFVVTLFALFELGVIPVMALPGHGRREIEHFVRLTNARAWLASESESTTNLRELGARLVDEITTLEHVILDVEDAGPHRTLSSLLSDAPLISGGLQTELDGHRVDPASIALLLCSGGTTGLPKLIPRTHRDYIYNATESAKVCELDESDAYLVALPAAHNFPLACPGILGALGAGARIVMCSSPSPDIAFDCIERTGATMTALVPPLVRVWLEHSAVPDSLRLLQAGGARLDASVAKRVPRELGCSLQQVFGMAEGLLNFTRASDPEVVVNSTQGRPLSNHDEIRIVDADGAEVPAGKRGELWTRGPYTLRGYYKDDEANRRSFTEDGFYRSGDLVRQLSTGHLVVEGRIKEVIRRGAETVSVETLEAILAAHPAIKDAAVVGLPCEQQGEQVCAVLVLSEPTASRPTLIELRHFLLEEGIARFMLPDSLAFINQIPLTAVGKIARQQLAQKIQTQKTSETEGIML